MSPTTMAWDRKGAGAGAFWARTGMRVALDMVVVLVSLVVWLENLAKFEPGGNAWENMVMVRLRGLWGS